MDRHRVAIVIPALNESATIGAVVRSIVPLGIAVVVDDGSSDDTFEEARSAGAEVVRHTVNQGYDGALNSGFQRADDLGCDYVITFDGDGQHDPATVVNFLRALDDGADIVVGIRDRHQRLAETVFSCVTRLRWGVRDPLSGLKAYRIGLWRELGHFDSYQSIGTELTLFAAAAGKRMVQLPVPTRDRVGAPKFGRRFSANLRILRACVQGMRGARVAHRRRVY